MIIGLAGYARSGKDTVADHLVKEYGFVKFSFADPMREALKALNPWIQVNDIARMPLVQALRVYSWEDLKTESPDVRPLLQRMGTEVGRKLFGESFWIDQALKLAASYDNVVFSDVRYMNEANVLKFEGGTVWRIERDGVGPANDHGSEHDLDGYSGFDARVSNDGSLEELTSTINKLLFNAKVGSWPAGLTS